MNRELVNLDDPQMTAYALGELSAAETAEFESRLQGSPLARRELAAMREVMSLLGEGLKGEWQAECERPTLRLLNPVDQTNVIAGQFRSVRRGFAAAAAVAAILLVGAAVVTSQRSDTTSSVMVSSGESAISNAAASHVPQLFLAEEVGDLSSLDLADGAEVSSPVIDASYLESDSIIPASFQPGQSASRSSGQDRAQALDRVDSYLPPMGGLVSGRGVTTGMIERRLGRGESKAATHSSSVLVSGYVTMGGGDSSVSPRLLGGFRPVSISANPVVNEESDLRLLADLNGLQKDLSEVIKEMPGDAAERADLERILARSQRVVSQLKMEMTR